jgi:hypothetical protein
MERMNNILKIVTILFSAISFLSFGIAALGGLIHSSGLVLFWYFGLMNILALMGIFVIASIALLFNFCREWIAVHHHQLIYRDLVSGKS